jgi:hypothetical protein
MFSDENKGCNYNTGYTSEKIKEQQIFFRLYDLFGTFAKK